MLHNEHIRYHGLFCVDVLVFRSFYFHSYFLFRLQCFDAVGWVAGKASGLEKTEWWGAGTVVCLEQGADLHTTQLTS